jgi:hypothetical protein
MTTLHNLAAVPFFAVALLGCQRTPEDNGPREADPIVEAERLIYQKKVARLAVMTLSEAAMTYFLENGVDWPRSLQVLAQRQPNGGKRLVTVDTLIDPWGKPYQYDHEGKRNGGDVADIWTVAPDGEEIGNWQRPERERRQAGKNPK